MAALHLATAVLHAAPKVTAADDKAHLHAHFHTSLNGSADLTDLSKIQAETIALGSFLTQRLTTDLQQDALILQFRQTNHSFIFILPYFNIRTAN